MKKKKFQWQMAVVMVLSLAIGGVCGAFIADFADRVTDGSLGAYIGAMLGLLAALYAAIYVHLILHEAGHYLAGRLSGYSFSSFRIGSFMWIREDGKLCLRRMSIAGTGGQCLMVPPEMVDGRIPVTLYNLGGSIMNAIVGLISLGLYFVVPESSVLSVLLMLMAIFGFVTALTNGIPMRMGMVDNDGRNALSLAKDPAALRAFWIQLKVNEQMTLGVRLKDMPEEWFAVPEDAAMKNSLVAALGVFACNRLMDEQRFAEADALMKRLMEIDSGIIGLHRSLMVCDRLYCELVGEDRAEVVDELLTKQQRKFMKSMGQFLSVMRTEYALALRRDRDAKKTEKVRNRFEKCAKFHPYAGDLQSERALMEIAERSIGAE